MAALDQFILFGDSITQAAFEPDRLGWGMYLANSYIRQVDVINRGFSGYTTEMCRGLLTPIIQSTLPPATTWKGTPSTTLLITIFLGANDAVLPDRNPGQAVPLVRYIENLHAMLDMISVHAPEARVLLITPPPCDPSFWPDRTVERTRMFRDACVKVYLNAKGLWGDALGLCDTWKLFFGEEMEWSKEVCDRMFYDGLHFSKGGNEALGLELVKVVSGLWGDSFKLNLSLPVVEPEKMMALLPRPVTDMQVETSIGTTSAVAGTGLGLQPSMALDQFLLFGDSLTQLSFDPVLSGWGMHLANRYIRRVDVINRGFSGFTSGQCKVLLENTLKSTLPSGHTGADVRAKTLLVTVLLGTNDAGQDVPLDLYKQNMHTIIHTIHTHAPHTNIILITPPPVNPQPSWNGWLTVAKARKYRNACVEVFAEALRSTSVDATMVLLDTWKLYFGESLEWKKDVAESILIDGIHFTALGNRILGAALIAEIEALGLKLSQKVQTIQDKNKEFSDFYQETSGTSSALDGISVSSMLALLGELFCGLLTKKCH